jgi:NifU-like protein involved in Fe-S cluster formation
MSAPLYSLDVLRLAAMTAEMPRLAAPSVTAEKRTPVCGSRIVIDLALDAHGRVVDRGYRVNACALGQASAALLGRGIIGRDAGQLRAATEALAAWLDGTRAAPPDWPGLDILAPARDYRGRHAAILLPFQAAAAAIEGAG